jgi:hypothetical protein
MGEKDDSLSQNSSELVMDYLQKNLEAGDTLEGIANWWLERERIEQVVDEVAAVLEELVKKGNIQVVRTPGGVSVYKIRNTMDN